MRARVYTRSLVVVAAEVKQEERVVLREKEREKEIQKVLDGAQA